MKFRFSAGFIRYTIVAVIWIIIFIIPVTLFRKYGETSWQDVFFAWQKLLPFLFLFLVNHFFLIPYFFLKKRSGWYYAIVVGVVLLLGVQKYLTFRDFPGPRPNAEFRVPPPMDDPQNGKIMPPPDGPGGFGGRPFRVPLFETINTILLGLLVIGLDTAMVLSARYNETEKQKARLEKENIKNQLSFLKHQISPHFFMNTLNNIHALIDIDAAEAKEAVIKLSRLMRYMLYESESGKVSLVKELEFIQSYINLMELRYSDKVDIKIAIQGSIPEKEIHPMLFLSLIENAFKHGISYKEPSFIHISIVFTQLRLVFEMKNSKVKNKPDSEFSGIGLENTRRRLDLIYGPQYQMNISETENMFMVNLSLPL